MREHGPPESSFAATSEPLSSKRRYVSPVQLAPVTPVVPMRTGTPSVKTTVKSLVLVVALEVLLRLNVLPPLLGPEVGAGDGEGAGVGAGAGVLLGVLPDVAPWMTVVPPQLAAP